MDEWEPVLEDEYLLKREPDSTKDVNAVAVVQKKQDYHGHATETPLPDVEVSFYPNSLTNKYSQLSLRRRRLGLVLCVRLREKSVL